MPSQKVSRPRRDPAQSGNVLHPCPVRFESLPLVQREKTADSRRGKSPWERSNGVNRCGVPPKSPSPLRLIGPYIWGFLLAILWMTCYKAVRIHHLLSPMGQYLSKGKGACQMRIKFKECSVPRPVAEC